MNLLRLCTVAAGFLHCCIATALTVPGADGTDGVFAPVANTTVQLDAATSAVWTDAGSGNGVYDAEKWAVVFKYGSVTIPAGVTVTFANHSEKAPVVWLVQGDVTIDGTIDISGAEPVDFGAFYTPAAGGPGGFRGGWSGRAGEHVGSSGYGPGGGKHGTGTAASVHGRGGSYGPGGTTHQDAPPYGNERILPLIGGSGGGAGRGLGANSGPTSGNWGGGGGGGAILIAAEGTITINGEILAIGGVAESFAGCGSGGAIRLVATTIAGNGTAKIHAKGGVAAGQPSGGPGRIRVEAEAFTHSWTNVSPAATTDTLAVGETVQVWPDDTDPGVRINSVHGASVPAEIKARFAFPGPDVLVTNASNATVFIETTHVPLAPLPTVELRIVARNAAPVQVLNATLVGGNDMVATWKVENIDFAPNWGTLQVKVELP